LYGFNQNILYGHLDFLVTLYFDSPLTCQLTVIRVLVDCQLNIC